MAQPCVGCENSVVADAKASFVRRGDYNLGPAAVTHAFRRRVPFAWSNSTAQPAIPPWRARACGSIASRSATQIMLRMHRAGI